jgi:secernin
MVVALPRATSDGRTLFGRNCNRPAREGQALVRVEGRAYVPGEMLSTGRVSLPQARQTFRVLAGRRAGLWGYPYGVNEHGVAVGITAICTRLAGDRDGLSGPDLARLALERTCSARQAVDLITDLVVRHGQQAADGIGNSSFLVADGREAFALETCGRFWAEQVVGSVRAVTDLCHLRQDWDRISRGLADCAVQNGWWTSDGSKLDFARAIASPGSNPSSLRRWGRATLLLEQHSGQIDLAFLRRLLGDHGDDTSVGPPLCRHPAGPEEEGTAVSWVVAAGLPGSLPIAWCAFGPPCAAVWFPLVLAGDLPAAYQAEGGAGGCRLWRRTTQLAAAVRRGAPRRAAVAEAVSVLQEQFDQDAREFLAEAAVIMQQGDHSRLHRLATALMQHHVERWEGVVDEWLPAEWRARGPHGRAFELAPVWE